MSLVMGAFTVDLEDWYHGIELEPASWSGKERRLWRGLEIILRLLDDAGCRATFFVLGVVAEEHPDAVRAIAAAGHEIASHGYDHRKLYEETPQGFRDKERRTKSLLEDLSGHPVHGFRAPYFSITRESIWALEELAALDYRYDCSISPSRTWRYGIAGAPPGRYYLADLGLWEFAPSTGRFLGRRFNLGGANFRILPLRFTLRAVSELLRAGVPPMFYVHPWEFDPAHPLVAFDWKAQVTHYAGLRRTASRTRRLLALHPFTTVSDVLASTTRQAQPRLTVDALRTPRAG